jgi:hypothetical protein
MGIDRIEQLVSQLDWHWTYQLRPRLADLTDDEYLWEPVPGCWSIRPSGQPGSALGSGPHRWGQGEFRLERATHGLDPPPVTTIAWRLAHMIVEVLGERVHAHFGGPTVDVATFDYSGTASGALQQLDEAYDAWTHGVRALGATGLERPCGLAEGPFAEMPLAGLVLHINREMIHHGAEVSLLRDLYRDRLSDPSSSV